MRAGLIVTGILGTGTTLVFALAALTATVFPNGTVVRTQWGGGWVERGWAVDPIPMPMPMPGGIIENDVFVEGVQVQVAVDEAGDEDAVRP